MTKQHIFYIILGIAAIIGWNAFLIQRDQKLFDAVYPNHCAKNCEVNHAI